jgi:hypothetical protein
VRPECWRRRGSIRPLNANQRALSHIQVAIVSQEFMESTMEHVRDSTKHLRLLSELLLTPPFSLEAKDHVPSIESQQIASALGEQDLEDLEVLVSTNHVILRAFAPLQKLLETGGNRQGAEWIAASVQREAARISHALEFLQQICSTLEECGCPVTVIKSLDHWPDLGSDLDLYTDADASRVVEVMRARFNAALAERSWGDRLANKWNFVVPELPELVEVHAGRLGQTGEQTVITRLLSARTRTTQVGGHPFRVPAPEDRIVISTLQRMYRHFYIRMCDIVDNARLLDQHLVDFGYLHSLSSEVGLWDGVATYLRIISEYVQAYRGIGVPLDSIVTRSAKFGTDQVRFRRNFLRVPILPHSLNLYASELMTLLLKGDLRNTCRLSLLPGLATAAALEQKMTGSDKGIW